MKLPNLPYGDQRMKQAMLAFGGVDYTPGAQSGQWEDTENVSCREYPALVPRESREATDPREGKTATGDVTALYVYDQLAMVIGTGFYYGDDPAPKCEVSEGRKQIVTLGDYIIIYPDKVFYSMSGGEGAEQKTIPIPYSPGVNCGQTPNNQYTITLPASDTSYSTDGTAGETLDGKGGVSVVNPTVTVKRSSIGGSDYISASFDSVRRGETIRIENVDYIVLNTETETRQYWPNKKRQYVTLHFGLYTDGEYVEHGTIGGWAYAADTTPYESGGTVDVWKKPGGVEQAKHLNQIVIGDLINNVYDTDNHVYSYDKVEYIDRTLYTDHYYYTEIRTKHYVGAETSYATWASYFGQFIGRGTQVRFEAEGVTIDTAVDIFTDRTLKLTDDIRALNGLSFTLSTRTEDQPDMEYICVHNNRLWGVAGNKIYASEWGYPINFTQNTTDTQKDPWDTEVAEDGEWTGIISYSGALLAFKEHVMYKIVGTMPENYTVYTYHVEGIKKGCHKSAVIIGEVLYYMGPGGVYAYSGSVPQLISENFGTRVYSDAVAGTEGRKYYISAKRPDGDLDVWDLHVLDTEKGIWLREDHLEVYDFARYKSKLYALDSQGRMLVFGSGNETISWYAVTAKLYEDIRTQYINIPIEHHSYSRFVIRVELDAGSTFNVETSYDGEAFTLCYKQLASRGQVYNVPIVPRRCDNMRIRLSGTGYFRLLGIVRAVHGGSSL